MTTIEKLDRIDRYIHALQCVRCALAMQAEMERRFELDKQRGSDVLEEIRKDLAYWRAEEKRAREQLARTKFALAKEADRSRERAAKTKETA